MRHDRFALAHPEWIVGAGSHRSGWPYVMRHLEPLQDPLGILLDDFVERTFCYLPDPTTQYDVPWAGVFHHPPHMPSFAPERHDPAELFATDGWRRNLPTLRHAVALSRHLGDWLREQLPVPVTVLSHPTEVPELKWSVDRYLANPTKCLHQFGMYLRNTRLIYQIPDTRGHLRIRSYADEPVWRQYDRDVLEYWRRQGLRPEQPVTVIEAKHCDNTMYDRILSENVVVTEVFSASANNLVLECLARNTPLLINPHPGVQEYLGRDYPLYFEALDDIYELLAPQRLAAASEYLSGRDKSGLQVEGFVAGMRGVLQAVARTL
jgi:hypothetical protein